MSFRTRRMGVAIAASVLVATVGLAPPASAVPVADTVTKLTKAVKISQVMNHLKKLQDIADDNGDRAAGRPGFAASVDYVVDQLEHAGYTPQVQAFTFPYADENNALSRANPATTWVDGTGLSAEQLRLRQFRKAQPPDRWYRSDLVVPAAGLPANSNTSGCETADFAGFTAGSVALVQRGTCGFAIKALNAQAAGASAVIVMNDGQPGRTGLAGMIGDATGLTIPAVFVTSAVGEDLASTPGAHGHGDGRLRRGGAHGLQRAGRNRHR